MKQPVHNDKYTIAWFKLAEFIARGEKERALGVYRLLSHSFEDRAFAQQLAGDIFISFGDTALAIERYCQAAQLYMQQGKKVQAAAIYEHLIMLDASGLHYYKNLIVLYADMHIYAKVGAYMCHYIQKAAQDHAWQEIQLVINRLLVDDHQDNVYSCYEAIISAIRSYRTGMHRAKVDVLIATIVSKIHDHHVSALMSYIQTIDDGLYAYACTILRSDE